MIPKDQWVWMPHAAHLIISRKCRFHLATRVGKFIVSTVGEYVPDSQVQQILADCRGIKLEGRGAAREADWLRKVGFEDLGFGRTYETMVFHAAPSKDECCLWRISDGLEIDFDGYRDAGIAYLGHLAMCEKWAGEQ